MKTFQTCDTTFVPAGSELKASPGRTEMRASSALLQVCRKGRGNAVCLLFTMASRHRVQDSVCSIFVLTLHQ